MPFSVFLPRVGFGKVCWIRAENVRKMCGYGIEFYGKLCCSSIAITKRTVICLRRNAPRDLIRWKTGDERKPLVLKGARQVGKTWLMKEFGASCYLARKTRELL